MLARRSLRRPEPPRVEVVAASPAPPDAASGPSTPELRSGAEPAAPLELELAEQSYRFTFTASNSFHAKLERARELSSHAVPSGDVGEVLERALDRFIDHELERRFGAGKPRKLRALKPGSRHVPREIARQVFERDGFQCTFVDRQGRRCQERRFLTLEHRRPFARGGPATVENLCVYCSAHNAFTAREAFGKDFIAEKQQAARAVEALPRSPPMPSAPDVYTKV